MALQVSYTKVNEQTAKMLAPIVAQIKASEFYGPAENLGGWKLSLYAGIYDPETVTPFKTLSAVLDSLNPSGNQEDRVGIELNGEFIFNRTKQNRNGADYSYIHITEKNPFAAFDVQDSVNDILAAMNVQTTAPVVGA